MEVSRKKNNQLIMKQKTYLCNNVGLLRVMYK